MQKATCNARQYYVGAWAYDSNRDSTMLLSFASNTQAASTPAPGPSSYPAMSSTAGPDSSYSTTGSAPVARPSRTTNAANNSATRATPTRR